MKENTAVATVAKQVAPVVQARQAIEQIAPRFTAIEGLKLQFDKEMGFAIQLLKKNSYLVERVISSCLDRFAQLKTN